MTPAIAPGAKVRGTATTVGGQGRGHLCQAKSAEAGFDDHLAGELHSCRTEIETEDGVAAHGTDATVEVSDGDAKEQAPDEAENRVAQITMEWWHGSRLDLAAEAVAHDEI